MNRINVVPQTRDILILAELAQYRAVTTGHIARLYFNGSYGAAQKRLYRLKQARLVQSYRTTLGHPDILQLLAYGYKLLALSQVPAYSWSQVKRRQRVRQSVLEHELAIMDCRVALELQSGATVLNHFSTQHVDRLFTFGALRWGDEGARPQPDAYIQMIRGNYQEHFALELDTGSQSRKVIEDKIKAYRATRLMYNGATRSSTSHNTPTIPYRVLFICKAEARRSEILQYLRNMHPRVHTFAAVATLPDIACRAFEEAIHHPADSDRNPPTKKQPEGC